MMQRHLLTTIALSCLLAGGCNAERDEIGAARAAPAPVPHKTTSNIRPGELKLPDRLRFSAVDRVRMAQSWDARLSTLTIAQQARLESLNVRYYGSLEFNSPEEQRKLIEAGFPMPEEWLAAEAMSDEELATLASEQRQIIERQTWHLRETNPGRASRSSRPTRSMRAPDAPPTGRRGRGRASIPRRRLPTPLRPYPARGLTPPTR